MHVLQLMTVVFQRVEVKTQAGEIAMAVAVEANYSDNLCVSNVDIAAVRCD